MLELEKSDLEQLERRLQDAFAVHWGVVESARGIDDQDLACREEYQRSLGALQLLETIGDVIGMPIRERRIVNEVQYAISTLVCKHFQHYQNEEKTKTFMADVYKMLKEKIARE